MHTDTASGGPDVRQKAEETASVIAQQAEQTATQQLSTQKERAASTLDTIAQTLRDSGQSLRSDQPQIASLTDEAAHRVEELSTYVRQHDVRQLVGEVENFARREPALFLGGAFAIGFLAARFLKASSPSRGGTGRTEYAGFRSTSYDDYRWTPEPSLSGTGTASPGAGESALGVSALGASAVGASIDAESYAGAQNYGTAEPVGAAESYATADDYRGADEFATSEGYDRSESELASSDYGIGGAGEEQQAGADERSDH